MWRRRRKLEKEKVSGIIQKKWKRKLRKILDGSTNGDGILFRRHKNVGDGDGSSGDGDGDGSSGGSSAN